ncbi:MAG: hypothetical protein U0166_11715 [Acidobacteriota bacterium]
MRTLRVATLGPKWIDRDEILLHVAFQVLVDFVDKERPAEVCDWNADARHRKAWSEIASLHRWWTKERPRRKYPLDDKSIPHPPMRFVKVPGRAGETLVPWSRKKYARYDRASKCQLLLERRWHAEDQRQLHRLIEVRPFLWT